MTHRPTHTVASVVAFIAACSSGGTGDTNTNTPPPPAPAPSLTMTAVAGQDLVTTWVDSLPVRPAVLIADSNGHPVSGIAVTFTTGPGNGTIAGATPVTGSDGVATAGKWSVSLPTGSKILTANAPGASPVFFSATVVGLAQIQKLNGFDQSEPVGTVVLDPPGLQVNVDPGVGTGPLVGAVVRFSVTAGGGTVTGDSTRTDSYGYARVGSWKLGPVPGTNKLSATVTWPGAKPVTFTATGTP